MVMAFQIKARTSDFLRERLRTDGHIRYTPKAYDTDKMGRNSDRQVDYAQEKYEPYEQVWLFFNNVIDGLYTASRTQREQYVVDLGTLQSYRQPDERVIQ